MDDFKEENTDEWKKILRTAFITGMSGNQEDRIQACVDVGYYYMCYAPSSLYKYYGDNSRSLETVKNNTMWYSAPCHFNDVFDCDLAIEEKEIFDSVLQMVPDKRGIRAGSPMWKQLKGTVSQKIRAFHSNFEDLRTKMGIACLSEAYDSLLMWAHYANNHCGMCVEYELLEFNRQLGFSPVPIVYSNERVRIHTLETLERDIQDLFVESLTSKSPEWSYEKEWRIIRDDGACGDRWDAERNGALLAAVRPKSVTLGCMAKPEFEKSVKAYCEENQSNLFRMERDKTLYRLLRVPVLRDPRKFCVIDKV